MKMEAVRNEDYQTAKDLKDKIQRLKNIGEQIALLESRKEKAIQKEDYESAMVLKQEIQRLRNQFEIGEKPGNNFGREENLEMQRMQREREIERKMKMTDPVFDRDIHAQRNFDQRQGQNFNEMERGNVQSMSTGMGLSLIHI